MIKKHEDFLPTYYEECGALYELSFSFLNHSSWLKLSNALPQRKVSKHIRDIKYGGTSNGKVLIINTKLLLEVLKYKLLH